MKATKPALLIFTTLLVSFILIGIATYAYLRLSNDKYEIASNLSTCSRELESDWNIMHIENEIAQLKDECISNSDENYKFVTKVQKEVKEVNKSYVQEYLAIEASSDGTVLGEFNNSSMLLVTSNQVYDQLATDRLACQNELDFTDCVCTNVQDLSETVNNFSLEEKLKLLLVPAFNKAEYDNLDASKYGFGGYVLIDSLAYTSADQVKAQSEILITNSSVPPFMALDAEGGVVQRLSWYNFKTLSSIKYLSDDEFCKEISAQSDALKSSGFNMSLAPVVDMAPSSDYWIYSRTIDTNPQITSDVASRYVSCMRDNGILTTGKHFPGHGSTKLDSHKVIPVSPINKDSWTNYDAIPFKGLIENDVPFIMTGHLRFENISSEVATLSSYWMNDVLRNELGYQNLIITDDLMMLTPEDSLECADLIAKAINNGGDMALFVHNDKCNSPEVVRMLIDKELITEEVVDLRLQNVLRIKQEYLCE